MSVKKVGSLLALIVIGITLTFFFLKEAGAPVTTSGQPVEKNSVTENKDTTEKNEALSTTTVIDEQAAPVVPPPAPKRTEKFLVVIDPGHQKHANTEKEPIAPGSNTTKIKVSAGTTGVSTKKPEYQLTLEAALLLKDLLLERGIDVILTREKNEVDISNKERAELANHHHADLFIRLHADGAADQHVSGFHILTPAEGNPVYEESLKASEAIISSVPQKRGIRVGGVSFRNDITGFNWSKVPTTLVEMGFMTNPEEDERLSNPAYLRELMTYIADGIVIYRGQAGA